MSTTGYQATRVVDQLHPRLVIVPMHYKTDVCTIKELEPVDAFLERKANIRRPAGNSNGTAEKSRDRLLDSEPRRGSRDTTDAGPSSGEGTDPAPGVAAQGDSPG